MLSIAANQSLSLSQPLLEGLEKYQKDPFSPCHPEGIINLGTAENRLLWPEILSQLNHHNSIEATALEYPTFYGSIKLREILANLLNGKLNWTKYKVNASNITCHAGCGSAVSNLVQAICDPDDGVLIPTPYYGGFDFDVVCYARAKIVPVDCDQNFLPTLDYLEKAYQSHPKVKMLILTNPGNPTGTVIPKELLLDILNWAKEKSLYVLSDEIYALSMWNPESKFDSVFSLTDIPDLEKTIVIWGLSKDFAMNGLRVGCIISHNLQLMKALHVFSIFTNISPAIDAILVRIFCDDWPINFIEKNTNALRIQSKRIMEFLQMMEIPFIVPDAAFFIWINLSRYLPHEPTHDDELNLWKRFIDAKVLISPGCAFHCSIPGWFRIVYSFDWDTTLFIGLQRILSVIQKGI